MEMEIEKEDGGRRKEKGKGEEKVVNRYRVGS